MVTYRMGRESSGMRRALIIASMTLAVLLTSGLTTYLLTKPKSPFPQTLRQSIHFPLYFPTQVPAHFTYDKSSLTANTQNQIVFYSFKNPNGKSININIQPKPDNYDIDAFYTRILSNVQGVTTPYGDAKIGTMGHATVGIMTNNKSWVIVKYSDTDFAPMISSLMSSFKQY